MSAAAPNRSNALTAVLISPDRVLAEQFTASIAQVRALEILLDVKSYPSEQTLEMRARQLQPDVVFVDVASNLETSVEMISHFNGSHPDIAVVALDRHSGPETILRILRAGATEFLYSPFDPANTTEALARLLKLRRTDTGGDQELGSVCVFSSVKPGSGASTLAAQTAFALVRSTSQRVLLADFDLMGGTIGFYLKLNHSASAVDAIQSADALDRVSWTSMISTSNGLDILSAPAAPYAEQVETSRVQCLLDYTRTMYDWIVLDLPVIFQRTSLITIPHSDRTFLVSTSELPSLHLARKSITLLERLGFPKDRFQMVINRWNSKRDRISRTDIEQLFQCPLHSSFPNDYFSLHQVVTMGQPLTGGSDLGKAIDNFAGQLANSARKTGATARDSK